MNTSSSHSAYQPFSTHGPRIRTDVVDVYVVQRLPASHPLERQRLRAQNDHRTEATWPQHTPIDNIYFLQLLRSEEPLKDTWHPVMGHIHAGESALDCAKRELTEELALAPDSTLIKGFWALEQTHPFFITAINTIVISPRFCIELDPSWSPTLNDEHTQHRLVHSSQINTYFMWPGQKACCKEIIEEIVINGSLSEKALRIR